MVRAQSQEDRTGWAQCLRRLVPGPNTLLSRRRTHNRHRRGAHSNHLCRSKGEGRLRGRRHQHNRQGSSSLGNHNSNPPRHGTLPRPLLPPRHRPPGGGRHRRNKGLRMATMHLRGSQRNSNSHSRVELMPPGTRALPNSTVRNHHTGSRHTHSHSRSRLEPLLLPHGRPKHRARVMVFPRRNNLGNRPRPSPLCPGWERNSNSRSSNRRPGKPRASTRTLSSSRERGMHR